MHRAACSSSSMRPPPTRREGRARHDRVESQTRRRCHCGGAALRSEKSGLDKSLRKAMNAEQYPDVSFHLDHYDLAPRAANRDTIGITAGGSLTIAGQERPIRLEARAYGAESGVWLEGNEA